VSSSSSSTLVEVASLVDGPVLEVDGPVLEVDGAVVGASVVAVVGTALDGAAVDDTVTVLLGARVAVVALVEVDADVDEVDVDGVDVDDPPTVGSDCDPTPTAAAPARTAVAARPAEASVTMAAVTTARRSMTD
jgi:hypothetical protein